MLPLDSGKNAKWFAIDYVVLLSRMIDPKLCILKITYLAHDFEITELSCYLR